MFNCSVDGAQHNRADNYGNKIPQNDDFLRELIRRLSIAHKEVKHLEVLIKIERNKLAQG